MAADPVLGASVGVTSTGGVSSPMELAEQQLEAAEASVVALQTSLRRLTEEAIAAAKARLRAQSMLLGKLMADPKLAADQRVQALQPRLDALNAQIDRLGASQEASQFVSHH